MNRENVKYLQYDHCGIRIMVPDGFKIKLCSNGFCASERKGPQGFAIELDPSGEVSESWKSILHGPLGKNPMLDMSVLKEGVVDVPYSGWERILECRKDGVVVDFGWAMYFCPKGHFVILQIDGVGSYEDSEPIWRKVINSLVIE